VASPADRAPAAVRPVQVEPGHYAFERYDDLERWSSYWYQVRSALRLAPRRVLEIGSGTGVFRSYLRNVGIEVKAADIDDSRKPDYIADVSRLGETLPAGEHFDVVAAFQVLEHLPFEELDACLAGIASRGTHALISLPYHGFQLRLAFAIGALRVSLGGYVPFPWRKRFDGEHHWELGRGHSVRRISRIFARHFEILERGFVKENPYHYLWVLRSRTPPAVR
jgi:2-polyprenyl-3-methyl-5-hydroxy-6-metoxy-1,4-benzoquinol methylase